MNIIFVVDNTILFKGSKLKIFFSTNPDLNPLFKKGYTIDNEYEIYCDETENLFNVNKIDIFSIEILAPFIMIGVSKQHSDFWKFVRTVREVSKKSTHSSYNNNLKNQYLSVSLWLESKELEFLEKEDITEYIKSLLLEINSLLSKKDKKNSDLTKKTRKAQKRSFEKKFLSKSKKYNIGVFSVNVKDLDIIKHSYSWHGRKNVLFDILMIYIKQTKKIFLSARKDVDIITKSTKKYIYTNNTYSKKEFQEIVSEIIELV